MYTKRYKVGFSRLLAQQVNNLKQLNEVWFDYRTWLYYGKQRASVENTGKHSSLLFQFRNMKTFLHQMYTYLLQF